MNAFELVKLALMALIHNRLRSLLTILGIVIGVAAVIALVSFGQSYQKYVDSQFQGIGASTLFISSSRPTGPNAQTIKPQPLTMADVQAIADPQNVPEVAAVAPVYNVNGTLVANSETMAQSVTGATDVYAMVQGRQISVGRFISAADVSAASPVAVLGTGIIQKLFPDNSVPVGQTLRINGVVFNIIGILQSTSGGTGPQDKVVVIPITTAQIRLSGDTSQTTSGEYLVSQISVKATGPDAVPQVTADITALLSARHNSQSVAAQDFRIFSQGGILNSLNSILGLLTVFLAAIAGISLLVGGIGVMNIMLVSVRERTREIGLRKAVGARYTDLLMQFLIESITLCLIGGLLGVALGIGIAMIGGLLLPTLSLSISIPAIILAVGVSSAIGVFFGLYPASRAAVLKPIEALRYE